MSLTTTTLADWTFCGQSFDDCTDWFGFVYVVTDLKQNRHYIGRKYFWSMVTRSTKGRKRKQQRESDWRSYATSSRTLQESVQQTPANYARRILYLTRTRGATNYLECRIQMQARVLERPNIFLNGIVSVRINAVAVRQLEYRADTDLEHELIGDEHAGNCPNSHGLR